jgi:hypothetical protein
MLHSRCNWLIIVWTVDLMGAAGQRQQLAGHAAKPHEACASDARHAYVAGSPTLGQ